MNELRWDLTEFGYSGPDDPAIDADLAAALEHAQEFEAEFKGRINSPDLNAVTLIGALTHYEESVRLLWKLGAYAFLSHSLDTQDDVASALLTKVEESSVPISNHCLFFGLEWKALPPEQADALVSNPDLAPWRHYLEASRLFAPYTLDESVEKALNEFSPVMDAWGKHFEKIIGRIKVLGVPLSKALSEAAYNPDRSVRQRYYKAITRALKREAPYIVDVINASLLEHLTDVRVRSFEGPMAPRNIGNEISAQAVEALLQACDDNAELVARYYRLKKRLMGIDRLTAYDRYAPIGLGEGKIGIEDTKQLIIAAFAEFSFTMGTAAEMAFEDGWFDTPTTQGKRGGAFAYPIPFIHPFILMNWTGKVKDALTLAHELGHGIHQHLCALLSLLVADAPITLAETASVFDEKLVFAKLKEQADPQERLALICSTIEDAIATSFRQAAITRFEQRLYEDRAEGELSLDAVNAMWLETQRAMFAGSVELPDSYGWWWVYIPHILRPFYCYGYTFGQFLVLALYAKYLEEGDSFVPKYIKLLSAGGSESPTELLAKLGIDVEDPTFWQKGLDILRQMVEEAEALAVELGY